MDGQIIRQRWSGILVSSFQGLWAQFRERPTVGRRPAPSRRIDLEDARDALLADIGLLDGRDVCLRRSAIEPDRRVGRAHWRMLP